MHQLAKALIEKHKLEIQTAMNAAANNNNSNTRASMLKSPRKGSNLAAQLISSISSNNSISPLDEAVSLFESSAEISKEVSYFIIIIKQSSILFKILIINYYYYHYYYYYKI